jgi:hypothetical protein
MEKRATAEQFERRLWRPMFHTVEITEDGLVMGAGTVLARMKRDASGAQVPALDEDRARVFALLAAAYGRTPPPDLSDLCRARISGHASALCRALDVGVEPSGASGAWG